MNKTKKGRLGTNPLFETLDKNQKAADTAEPGADVEKEQNTARAGLKPGHTRATFIMKNDHVEKIKAVAYWERLNINEIVDEVFDHYLTAYEKRKGTIKPIEKKKNALK